ncbi:MAG: hypothetical protein ACPL1G_01295 [Thermodesulfovibrionales bacterium]
MINDIEDFVKKVKKEIGGTLVEFKKGDTLRLVLKNGITMDFSSPKGSIKEDLSRRDFTINAIAWSPETGIIDPYGGMIDIEKRIVRSISKNNLIDDPLRMLRAYRLASELDGEIDPKTRKFIKTFYYNIKKVSSERITFEIFNLLNSKNPGKYLKMALDDKILTHIFPLKINKLRNNIKAVSNFIKNLEEYPVKLKAILKDNISQNLTYKGLLILELLLTNNGSFISDIFPLKMSKFIIKRLRYLNKGIKEYKKGDLFNFFLKSKESAIDMILLENKLNLIEEYNRFKKIWKKGLINSIEIKKIGNIKDGETLGKIIIELKRAEFERKIKTKDGVKKYLLKILHNISYQT